MGSAEGEAAAVEALHGPRLKTLLERLVDSGVRGLVYEGAGTAPAAVLVEGAEEVRLAGATWRMPAEVVLAEPGRRGVGARDARGRGARAGRLGAARPGRGRRERVAGFSSAG